MLNKFTIFLLLFIYWNICLLFINVINLYYFIYGFFVSILITSFLFKAGIISTNTKFVFLQFGFYTYFFSKIFSKFFDMLSMCFNFLNPSIKYSPIIDYIFLNKDSDSDASITANLLNILPGTFGFLVIKRYLILYSLDIRYFSLKEMYDISVEIEKIYDDSLI